MSRTGKVITTFREISGFRYNNRENPYMFRNAMLKWLLAETLPYAKLIEEK